MQTAATAQAHIPNIGTFFINLFSDIAAHGTSGTAGAFLVSLWSVVTAVSILVTFFLLGLLTYATIRLNQTKHEEHHHYDTLPPAQAEHDVENSRWHHVSSLVESGQESDWRQAIIEADIMLDDILGVHGYLGASVGEKLKMADPSKFRTLQDAWDAHKVRNDIAHQGSEFHLTGQIAYRTVAKYKNVFEEFHAI
ncbi:MAG TPA: hypothetical protein VHB93_02150 [Candidatus Paceibacterota bacterium]|nr:hypothetical protein [Candidatus Paceibacterota bacterium]